VNRLCGHYSGCHLVFTIRVGLKIASDGIIKDEEIKKEGDDLVRSDEFIDAPSEDKYVTVRRST